MLRRAAGLPDPLVGLLPHARRALGLGLHERPEAVRQALGLRRVEQDRVEHRAEDVVLPLIERAVADPHRLRARIAGEVVERRLRQLPAAVDPVHDLQRAVVGRLDVGDELHELVGLPVEPEPVEGLEGERRVAHPRVPVVPVALAARGLGQRGGRRRHGGARRHVGEALDHERRALDRIAPAVVGDPRPAEPAAPEPRRRREPRLGLVDVLRGRELLGPRQRAERAVARFQHVAAAHPVALDPECEVRLEADGRGLPGHARVCRMAAAVDERPGGRLAAVVEGRFADELDLDAALDALDCAHQHVVGVVVGRRPRVGRDPVLVLGRPEGERVADDDPAVRASSTSSRAPSSPARRSWRSGGGARTARTGTCPPRGRAGCRTGSARQRRARTASRPSRRARRARRCGSRRRTRSPRSAGTATARQRSAGL